MRLNRDAAVALGLALFVAVMAMESFNIRRTAFSSLPAATWPRLLLGALGVLTAVYLAQSLRGRVAPAELDEIERGAPPGLLAAWRRHGNPVLCFVAFLAFIALIPALGMLLGGVAFVFVCLCLLGERTLRATALHAVVALVSVTAMWAVFTYGLGVFLPAGRILPLR